MRNSLERGETPSYWVASTSDDLPAERAKTGSRSGMGNTVLCDVQLAVVAVHQHAEIIQMVLAGVHHRFPDGAFLQFSVADHAVGIEMRARAARRWQSPGPRRSPCPMGPVAICTPGSTGPGWPLRCFRKSANSSARSDRSSPVRHRSTPAPPPHGPCSATNMSWPRRVGSAISISMKPAVVQRHQRDDGGKCAAGVQAVIDRVAALLQGEDADVGILDFEQLQDTLRSTIAGLARGRATRSACRNRPS